MEDNKVRHSSTASDYLSPLAIMKAKWLGRQAKLCKSPLTFKPGQPKGSSLTTLRDRSFEVRKDTQGYHHFFARKADHYLDEILPDEESLREEKVEELTDAMCFELVTDCELLASEGGELLAPSRYCQDLLF